MIRIAICDDEKNIRTYLCKLVRKQDSESEITEYASADEYLSGDMEHDLLFLDVEMKGAASGRISQCCGGVFCRNGIAVWSPIYHAFVDQP